MNAPAAISLGVDLGFGENAGAQGSEDGEELVGVRAPWVAAKPIAAVEKKPT